MPTPTGLLKPGDIIRHKDTGEECVVTERLGNDISYSVRMKKRDGSKFANRRSESILTTAGWWIKHGWELVT